MSKIDPMLQPYFETEAASFSGRFGLAAQRLDTGQSILYRAAEVFPTASVIKLVVTAWLFLPTTARTTGPTRIMKRPYLSPASRSGFMIVGAYEDLKGF